MTITSVTAMKGATRNLGDYNNVKAEFTITAFIEEGVDASAVLDNLRAIIDQQLAKAINGASAASADTRAASADTTPPTWTGGVLLSSGRVADEGQLGVNDPDGEDYDRADDTAGARRAKRVSGEKVAEFRKRAGDSRMSEEKCKEYIRAADLDVVAAAARYAADVAADPVGAKWDAGDDALDLTSDSADILIIDPVAGTVTRPNPAFELDSDPLPPGATEDGAFDFLGDDTPAPAVQVDYPTMIAKLNELSAAGKITVQDMRKIAEKHGFVRPVEIKDDAAKINAFFADVVAAAGA